MQEHSIVLEDGRKLAYATYGSPEGWPVLYFHGTPSSRLEPRLLFAFGVDVERLLEQAGLQLIAVDRPGMGLSSFDPNGTFLSVAADCSVLLQNLGIENCSLLSWSGGGPFALALAAQYPWLVKNLFHICTFTRAFTAEISRKMTMNKWYFLSAKYIPSLLKFSMNQIRKNNSHHSAPQWITGVSAVDHQLLKNPAHFKAVTSYTLKESSRVNANGPVHEACLYLNDFGFDLKNIQQQVHYWWGMEDKVVVRLHAEAVEQQVKNNVMHYIPGEGHLSIYVNYFSEVLQTIAVRTL